MLYDNANYMFCSKPKSNKSNYLINNIQKNFFKDFLYNTKKNSLFKCTINQLIVHSEYGIGKYKGLKIIKTSNIETEYLIILYADKTKLYVPIYSLYLIHNYSNNLQKNNIILNKIGNDTWIKEYRKISKKIYNIAAELLHIYSVRKNSVGFSFRNDNEKYNLFVKQFVFKTTIDQEYVINSVLNDMYKPFPMDRIICGDVGFGKTEVAMRAAFIAFLNKKQVMILSPTTLLVQQHLISFKKRFSKWPVNINALSRLYSLEDRKETIFSIEKGLTHIVIGTHELLFKEINWYDVGLLIIDEEHRFGVKHKEQIKKKYTNIDILTLTATPIPRTLNMTMTGLRDLSIINTAPLERCSVKTYIKSYDKLLIRKNVLKEINRGGQVYYIHNNIKTILNTTLYLRKLIPEASIVMGHGKMQANILKKIIYNFSQKKFNVLVCTTIIETGIDVPTVNTIFIENADHFGLAQLHQLRGRVGRSNQQAYAWLLVTDIKNVTTNAKKRLDSIANNSKIGSGFKLSLHDLEIRGVGTLLGNKQSGYIENIGSVLYIKLLREAIENIKESKNTIYSSSVNSYPKVELNVSTTFPLNYITSSHKRFYYYKLISNAKNNIEFLLVKSLLIHSFGFIPNTVKNLIKIVKIQLISKQIGIESIKINTKGGFIQFKKENYVNPLFLVQIINREPKYWKLKNNVYLIIIRNLSNEYTRINWIFYFIKKLKKISTINHI